MLDSLHFVNIQQLHLPGGFDGASVAQIRGYVVTEGEENRLLRLLKSQMFLSGEHIIIFNEELHWTWMKQANHRQDFTLMIVWLVEIR